MFKIYLHLFKVKLGKTHSKNLYIILFYLNSYLWNSFSFV